MNLDGSDLKALFHDVAKDHTEDNRHNRKVQAPQDHAEQPYTRSNRTISNRIAKAVNTDKGQQQNANP